MAEAAERCRRHATYQSVAHHLHIPERTLRLWRHLSKDKPKLRGRPPCGVPVDRRRPVIQFLHRVSGPAIGLPALRALFPGERRCTLADILRRYRRVWRRRHQRTGYRLQWHRPGTVWAMDHSEATQLIDGQYEQIFAVRDLASHRQLVWRGVLSTDAAEACSILEELFERHGPPLVLKSDNGPAFIAEVMQELLRRHRITPLFSPKRRPQYNGAIERGNSTHKVYTHQQAVSEDHPRYWTTANLDAARQLSNTISRPWGHRGPSPEEAWKQREPITHPQRHEFERELECQRDLACLELGFTNRENLTPIQQDRLERLAVSQTLELLGYYTKREVRRPPRKAKRRPLPQLQQALKRQREEEANADPASDSDANNIDPDEAMQKTLATLPASATIYGVPQDANANSVQVPPAQNPEPPHREPAKPSWRRKAITLVKKLAKAANISH